MLVGLMLMLMLMMYVRVVPVLFVLDVARVQYVLNNRYVPNVLILI